MKTLKTMATLMMATTLTACNTVPAKAVSTEGRIIEFKSGPEGFDTRTFFYEGANEVIAFDSQFTPALAEASIKHLRTYTDKPITRLIITHPNPDKFNGASVFKAQGARLLASKATAEAIPGVHQYKQYYFVEMAKMFKKDEYPQPVPVDETFSGQMDLRLEDGTKIQLRELSQPGVSSTQTVAYIESTNTLMVGDLVHHQAHAWLEGGIVKGQPTPTIGGWIADLRELASLYPQDAQVFGGRGKTVALSAAVPEQVRYLQGARELIRSELKSIGTQAKEFKGGGAADLYRGLAGKFKQSFPGYDLPYMIEYGSYGLVQSEMVGLGTN